VPGSDKVKKVGVCKGTIGNVGGHRHDRVERAREKERAREREREREVRAEAHQSLVTLEHARQALSLRASSRVSACIGKSTKQGEVVNTVPPTVGSRPPTTHLDL